MTDLLTLKSSEIKVGDIVHAHGMRVRIDSTTYYKDANTYGGGFHAHEGTVTNLDEVLRADIVPASFLTTHAWVDGQGWTIDRRDRWVVQGNDLATWLVERDDRCTTCHRDAHRPGMPTTGHGHAYTH